MNTKWEKLFFRTMIGSIILVALFMGTVLSLYVYKSITGDGKAETTLLSEIDNCKTYSVTTFWERTYFTKCTDTSKVINSYEVQRGDTKKLMHTETILE